MLGTPQVRTQLPHLTLAHPRNAKAPENEMHSVASLRDGVTIRFSYVHFIEQVDSMPWVVRHIAPISGKGECA
jgi:hypothetical protein